LLGVAAVAGSGFQGSIASYGALANNAHKIVHLTTYHNMTRHRANICAQLGTACSHGGKVVTAVCAFFSTTMVAVTLLAQKWTSIGGDYKNVVGSILSEWSTAGILLGVVGTFMFSANTLMSCINMAKILMKYCKENPNVDRVARLPFPQMHIKPLKILTAFGTVKSMRMVFSPLINTLCTPVIGGLFLGAKGLLFLINGSNAACLCVSLFLINCGSSWDSAKKFVMLGLLKDDEGQPVGPDDPLFAHLKVGQQIGGALEDTTGPACNNFVKFVAVFAFVTEKLYDPTPENTWTWGFVAMVCSLMLVVFAKFGLTLTLTLVASILRRRQKRQQFEEGMDEDGEHDFEHQADQE